MSQNPLSRRHFLKLSTTLSAGIFVAPAFLRSQTPNNKLNIAVIGVAGRGGDNLASLLGHNIVALCDVDSTSIDKAKQQIEKGQGTAFSGQVFEDYRKLYDNLKNFDAVVISTPDHHHYPATIRALKMKKHVYCEKPLTHTIWEARDIQKRAREANVATQMGNQGNAGENIRLASEWVKSGAIGKVKEVHCWSNRPVWPQGVTWPTEADPIPANLNWDLWLGPAAERPYYAECAPFKWRGFWDFGTGAFGDMGCHILNWPYTALDLGAPISGECVSQENATKDSPPTREVIRLDFPAKGDRMAVSVFWHDGGNLPSAETFGGEIPTRDGDDHPTQNGTLFVGASGLLYCDYDRGAPTLLPREKMKDTPVPPKTLARSPGHHEEWLNAATGDGTRPGSNFVDKASGLTQMVLLGHLAARLGAGKKFEWDAATGHVPNIPEAEQYINTTYRPGWKI